MDIQRFAVGLVAFAVVAVGVGSSVASGQGGPPPAAQPAQSTRSTQSTQPAKPAPSTIGTALGQDVTLAVGQEAAVEGKDLAVRFSRLVADSRCRPGMQCFWEGEATVALLLSEPGRGESTKVELHSGPRGGPQATTFAACRVELVSVSRDGGQITLRIS